MSLLNLMNETLENFDPSKDTPGSVENIPAGVYDVVVEKAGHRVYDSGYDAIALTLKVLTGDYTDRQELININIDPEFRVNKEWPDLLRKNMQLISQFIFVTNAKLDEDDWQDQMTVGSALARESLGEQLLLEISESTGKKGKVYRNYKFTKYDEDVPF